MTMTPFTDFTIFELRERLSQNAVSLQEVKRIAMEAATAVRDQAIAGAYSRDAVSILGELTACGSVEIEEVATKALFMDLIEPLNDSFEPSQADIADRVMAQLIDRHRQASVELSQDLARFGLSSEDEMLTRRIAALDGAPSVQRSQVKSILVLSRITVGADVAVTSVIIGHLKRAFPDAEVVFVGPRKLRQIFGGDDRLSFREVEYARTATLRDRLGVWASMLRAVDPATHGLAEGELLVVDPDSRMTQLGLLPPVEPQWNYVLFDSRRIGHGTNQSLVEIARNWCAQRWPVEDGGEAYSFVAPHTKTVIGRGFRQALGGSRKRSLIFVSLGVGGNERKRLPAEAENALIDRLLERAALVVDCGATDEERAQIAGIAETLRRKGLRIIEAHESSLDLASLETADVLVWEGGLGTFAQVLAVCDAYVGYDSAGQHIAAALGRPLLTLFAEGETPRFADRWRATGRGPTMTLRFIPGQPLDAQAIIEEAMIALGKVCKEGRRATEY
jgi:ADP-heptose:LPS heptosyltransferase